MEAAAEKAKFVGSFERALKKFERAVEAMARGELVMKETFGVRESVEKAYRKAYCVCEPAEYETMGARLRAVLVRRAGAEEEGRAVLAAKRAVECKALEAEIREARRPYEWMSK